jgi:peptidoglycan-N-acetylglucosamine deacetylase
VTAVSLCCAGVIAGAWLLSTVVAHPILLYLGGSVLRRGKSADAIALTFDDGPLPERTRRICRILEEHGARGTFFVLGERVSEHPEILCELVERGHEIQLHGFRHRHLWFTPPWVLKRELRQAIGILDEVAGIRPRFFRPPWGMCGLAGAIIVRSLGMRTVRWSVCPEGFFRPRSPERLAERVLCRIRGGDIVCLHDAGGFDDTPERVAECLAILLPKLREMGLGALALGDVVAGGAARAPEEF